MKKSSLVFPFALALLALSLTPTRAMAEAAGGKSAKPSKATLEKYDADKDGTLNDEEKANAKAGAAAKAKQTREENLAKYDANKDGKLDEAEKAARKSDEDAAKAARKAKQTAP